jgi:hypothetical protein
MIKKILFFLTFFVISGCEFDPQVHVHGKIIAKQYCAPFYAVTSYDVLFIDEKTKCPVSKVISFTEFQHLKIGDTISTNVSKSLLHK